jgi:hypothetical protein
MAELSFDEGFHEVYLQQHIHAHEQAAALEVAGVLKEDHDMKAQPSGKLGRPTSSDSANASSSLYHLHMPATTVATRTQHTSFCYNLHMPATTVATCTQHTSFCCRTRRTCPF